MSKLVITRALKVLVLLSSGTVMAASYSPQVPRKAPGPAISSFDKFSSLRSRVLDIIGSSKSRLVIATDLLTDGHISSALYLAKYRKVKVNVLLKKSKAGSYLSRLRYLKAQGISVSDRPSDLDPDFPTVIMQDTRLYRITRDLNVLRPELGGQVLAASPKDLKAFVKVLTRVFQGSEQLVPKPLMQIKSRPSRGRGRRYRRNSEYYNYDRSAPSRRPRNVPTKLPQATIIQNRRKEDKQEQRDPSIVSPSLSIQGDPLHE